MTENATAPATSLIIYFLNLQIEYASYCNGIFLAKILNDLLGEVTKFELSAVVISDTGALKSILPIALPAEIKTTVYDNNM